ncbi:MAG TPA: hypothetical protein VN442_17620 [Bryobacteraceae bacterium]|nr:hypothetical protein [Bryobacteraceae bacterium]
MGFKKWIVAGRGRASRRGLRARDGRPAGPRKGSVPARELETGWKACGLAWKGRVIVFPGDAEPGEPYARFVQDELRVPQLRVLDALWMEKPGTYTGACSKTAALLLKFRDDAAAVRPRGGEALRIEPYTIVVK